MTAPVIISIIALTISCVSASVSSVAAIRQFDQYKRVNHFPVVAQLLSEFRHTEFHVRYDYVINKLNHEHAPNLGLLGLPEPARSHVIDVAFYFQTFASLREFGILDESKNLGNLYLRIVEVWESIEPYVQAERAQSSGANKNTLALLETYAHRLGQNPRAPGLVARHTP